MSNSCKQPNDLISTIVFSLLVAYIFEVTKPSNPNRPHWFEFYSIWALAWSVMTFFIFLESPPGSSNENYITGNLIFLLVFGCFFAINLFSDLSIVKSERSIAKQKALQGKLCYIDPYPPVWGRRMFVYLVFWLVHLLWGNPGISIEFSVTLLLILVVLYGIRDILYSDHCEVIGIESKLSKKRTKV